MRQRILTAILATVICTAFASAADIRGLYFEVEPNGTVAEAIANNHVGTYVAPGDGTSIEGYLDSGDVDWYAFTVADDAYIGAAAFDPLGAGADAQFQLIDTLGTIIDWDDDSGVGLMPSLDANIPAGTYLLGVSAYADVTSSTGLTELFDGIDNFTGGPTDANFTYKVSIIANVVPEPSSLALLALGGLLMRRR
jgi:hypothetical protein